MQNTILYLNQFNRVVVILLPNPIFMKTQVLQLTLSILALFSFPDFNFSQAPDLGTAANFVLFTKTGAVGNTGISHVVGYVGTNNGAITGFEPPTTIAGNIESANATTTQCALDVQAAYDELFNTAATSTSHTPTFGSGETLFAGVYSIAAAGSAAGNLTLDAQGDPSAVFIFKFGGAFTTGASTTVNLINDASACNVFWVAEGAISMAASTTMKGTLIANNGAISMGAGGLLEGRMLSTTGAASIYQVEASAPCILFILPVTLLSFTGSCDKQNVVLKWSTASETNNRYFTIEKSVKGLNWQVAGTMAGTGNSVSPSAYMFIDKLPNEEDAVYRLKQTDDDGNYKYGKTVAIKKCVDDADILTVYPNPTRGKFELLFRGNIGEVQSINIFNTDGRKLYHSNSFQSNFDLSDKLPGIYLMQVQLNSKIINLKIVLEK